MKNHDFFKELDDMDIEKIAQDFPVLTDEEKERIFAMSERKYNIESNIKTDKNETKDDSEDGVVVSGVERYNRPLWHRYTSIAAAAVLAVGGITGSMLLLKKRPSVINTTDQTTTTINISKTTETATTASVTESELREYNEIAAELTDKLAHYEKVLYYHDVDIDENDTLTFTVFNSKRPDEGSHEEKYCRVTDSEIQSGDDLKNALFSIFTDDFKNELINSSSIYNEGDIELSSMTTLYLQEDFGNDLSEYKNGDTIDAAELEYKTCRFITYNGNLYACTNNMIKDKDFYSSEPVVNTELSSFTDYFKASRFAPTLPFSSYANDRVGTKLTFSIKNENGEWKIDGIDEGRNVESLAATAVQVYFNKGSVSYSPDELDIDDDFTEDGTVTAFGFDKIRDALEIIANDDDKNCRIKCTLRDKAGRDYIVFNSDIEFSTGTPNHVRYRTGSEDEYSKYFTFSNVNITPVSDNS
ncbi:hypothetical protein [Ruminococcus sp.]|uniref:hypothetical protein n=1 Tax=Ruminococcus sp. TaxID=41978 RepID=UPI001B7457DD|nr:hypothetical protein [Ruminococcus sp.]MBP5431875.1 hypothetical protein [Ruminococcus sp.]